MTPPLIDAVGIRKAYTIGNRTIHVINGIDFVVRAGEFVAVTGPSGSGKSTLLHILGCLDRPTGGTYRFDGANALEMSDRELSRLRADRIGFVFQTFNLIPTLNVYENVELPFLYRSKQDGSTRQHIESAIERVGLGERMRHRPAELSGGEMQRVAIARAIAIRPRLILADEPTGNLDSKTGSEILSIFQGLHEQGATLVLITHDQQVAAKAERRVELVDGRMHAGLRD